MLLVIPLLSNTSDPQDPGVLTSNLNSLWILIGAILVFFMQLGFLMLEVGFVQPKTVLSVALKNCIDVVVVFLAFYFIGQIFMFGNSYQGILGFDLTIFDRYSNEEELFPYAFFLFQVGFAAAAATIVSGAMAGRTGFVSYVIVASVIGLLIYPVFGHWVWGNALEPDNQPFLAKLGFMDFAGGMVVHGIGGFISFVAIKFLGPRIGRFDANGKANEMENTKFSYAWVASGVLVLWTGWWGFNGASTLGVTANAGKVLLNTNISAVCAGLVAFLEAKTIGKKAYLNEKFLGGLLGGLVAITPCANVVSPSFAILIGLLAGLIHNLGFNIVLHKWKLDDPVGAIPVHGFCGVFGTLAVALFGDSSFFPNGNDRLDQILIQMFGIIVCFVWASSTSLILFKFLKSTIGLRVSPEEEIAGIDISRQEEIIEMTPEDDDMDEDELKSLLG